jgi:putative spermidine/putrescine transport system permease protein
MSNSSDSVLAVATATPASAGVASGSGGPLGWFRGMRWGDYLGVAPFLIFAVLFLIVPTVFLMASAFVGRDGGFTLQNIANLNTPQILNSFWISIRVSVASAVIGALIGLILALAVIRGRLPQAVRSTVLTFSGVASQFAGIPLAFAFISTLGRLGLVTWLFKAYLGFDIYRAGFNLLSFWGLTITYCYFQIPLMILIIAPAIDGLKKEWSEAAATLGATPAQFWRYVGLPVLWPNLLGTLSLLFANAFGAIATAYALTGSSLNIVPILLYAQIRGDVLNDPGLGAALALGMIIIAALANVVYLVIRTRAERWLK